MAGLILILMLNSMIHFRKISRNEFIQYGPENLLSAVLIISVVAAQYLAGISLHDAIGLVIVAPALRWIIHDLTLNYLRGLRWDYLGTRSKLDRLLRRFQNKTGLHYIVVKAALLGVSLCGSGVSTILTTV